jgi:uncharacterized protein with beta-barrel porin domain
VEVNPVIIVGFYGGWTSGHSDSKGINSKIDSNTLHLGGFGRFKGQNEAKGLNVTGDLAYSTTQNDSSRTVPLQIGSQKMKANYGLYVISGGLEVGYDWEPDDYTRVTPYIAGRYSYLSQASYTENGNLPLKVGSIQQDQFASTLGVRMARDFVVSNDSVIITPGVNAAWLHNWSKDQISARSSFVGSPVSFDTRSVPQDSDAAQLGAGLDLRFKQNGGWDFGIKAAYGADMRSSSTGHTFFGGFEVNF